LHLFVLVLSSPLSTIQILILCKVEACALFADSEAFNDRMQLCGITIIIIVDRTRSTHKHNKANVKKEKKIS